MFLKNLDDKIDCICTRFDDDDDVYPYHAVKRIV